MKHAGSDGFFQSIIASQAVSYFFDVIDDMIDPQRWKDWTKSTLLTHKNTISYEGQRYIVIMLFYQRIVSANFTPPIRGKLPMEDALGPDVVDIKCNGGC
jgi:hypothetical protein